MAVYFLKNPAQQLLLVFAALLLGGCGARPSADQAAFSAAAPVLEQVAITEASPYSTVGLDSFVLITSNRTTETAVAKEIMAVKRKWPLAMQTKDRALFESILASGFTFRGEEEFFNREEYINNRVTSTGLVDTAIYQNVVVQLFGETALLTYRNIVSGKDTLQQPEKWQYSWADFFSKEKGQWKISASHHIQGSKIR